MDQIQACEPFIPEVIRPERKRCSSIRHERPLAAGRDQDADPTRALAGNAGRANPDAIRLELGHEASTRPIPSDSTHELDIRAEAGEPAGSVRGRSTLPDTDAPGHIRTALDRPLRGEHHIENKVSEHEDARLLRDGHTSMVSVSCPALVGSLRCLI